MYCGRGQGQAGPRKDGLEPMSWVLMAPGLDALQEKLVPFVADIWPRHWRSQRGNEAKVKPLQAWPPLFDNDNPPTIWA